MEADDVKKIRDFANRIEQRSVMLFRSNKTSIEIGDTYTVVYISDTDCILVAGIPKSTETKQEPDSTINKPTFKRSLADQAFNIYSATVEGNKAAYEAFGAPDDTTSPQEGP